MLRFFIVERAKTAMKAYEERDKSWGNQQNIINFCQSFPWVLQLENEQSVTYNDKPCDMLRITHCQQDLEACLKT